MEGGVPAEVNGVALDVDSGAEGEPGADGRRRRAVFREDGDEGGAAEGDGSRLAVEKGSRGESGRSGGRVGNRSVVSQQVDAAVERDGGGGDEGAGIANLASGHCD